MKEKILALGVFIKDHIMLVALAAAAMFVFLFLPHFREFAYGLFRAFVAIFFVAVIIYIWFKDTIRPYLVNGTFVEDFKALEAKHRVATALTVIIVVVWLVIETLVHP